ncbi:MAG: hypothetical protein ACXQS5_04840 [Candidatus Methanospirareceae archaeon]
MTRPRRSSSGGIIFLDWRSSTYEEETLSQTDLPLPPVNAIIGCLSPFRIKVDRGVYGSRCVRKHEKTFAMTSESRARGEIGDGVRCMHICPNGAIDYRLIGTEIGVRPIFVVLGTLKQIVYPIYPLKPQPHHPAMNSGASDATCRTNIAALTD